MRRLSFCLKLRSLLGLTLFLNGINFASAAQMGPYLPTHNYPTDSSFHLRYRLGLMNSSTNFIDTLTTDALLSNSSIKVTRHQFIPEFQANHQLSLGAIFQLDTMTLVRPEGTNVSKSAASDQVIFGEYRFYDRVGASLGMATLIKFPLYSNPTLVEIQNSEDPNNAVLLGDGQIDLTALLTGEIWVNQVLRLRADLGYTFRSDGFAPELPYMGSVGFVTPKMDLDLRFRGNLALGSGDPSTGDIDNLVAKFANSKYAYSGNPWHLIMEPSVDLWITPKFAVNILYAYSLMGNNSPSFQYFSAGLVYRWAARKDKTVRTFKEVKLDTDLESGKFEGEEYLPNEIAPTQDTPILDEVGDPKFN